MPDQVTVGTADLIASFVTALMHEAISNEEQEAEQWARNEVARLTGIVAAQPQITERVE